MNRRMRDVVRRGYERDAYDAVFRADPVLRPFETGLLEALIRDLPPRARILDLGSGTGVPYDSFLAGKGFRVTGVDFCPKHLALAKKNVPRAEYLQGDFSRMGFSSGAFDAAVSFYAIFHLPRREHPALFADIRRWLKPGGRLLVTLGTGETECDEEADWLGAPMMWSSNTPEEYLRILDETGFALRRSEYEGSPGDEEYHFWVLAQRI